MDENLNYINYSELTEKEKEEMTHKNRDVLEELNEYLYTHEHVTYGQLYDILGVPCPKDMTNRLIDRWPD